MRNLGKVYGIMIHRWVHIIIGVFFSLGYAAFSGISLLMVIPLLDNVFVANKPVQIYETFPQFWLQIKTVISEYISELGGISNVIHQDNYQPLLDELSLIMQQSNPVMLLWTIAILFSILTIFKNIFFYGQKVTYAYLQGYTIMELRNKMYHRYLYQSLAFFNKNRTGDSLVRMVNDVEIVNLMFIDNMFRSVQDLILIAVYLTTAITINSRLLLVAVVVLPLFSLAVTQIGSKVKKYAKRIQNQISQLFSYVEEILSSIKIVKAFSRESDEYKKFSAINHKHFRFWFKARMYAVTSTPISEMNSVIIGAFVLVIGGKQVLAPGSNFSFGNFMAFLFAIFSMLHPIKNLTKTYANIRKALVSLDRIAEILNNKSEIIDSPHAQHKNTFENAIVLKNLCFSYDNQNEVLSDINLTINKGEKIAFVGSSGSGKTTITNLLTRMYDATKGDILIDDTPIKNIQIKDLRRLFGTVTQESILFSDTVNNNIAYGSLQDVSQQDIINAAQIANADEFINNLPQQYDTMLDTKAGNLSGGQKQRLCIARSIVGDPPVLIFDEATSALDTEAEQKVQKAIEQATKDRTVIMIAHRLSTILNSDKIIVLDNGKIVGCGTHADLLDSNPRYQTLYNLQFSDNSSS